MPRVSITSWLHGAQRTKEGKVMMFTPLPPACQAMICVPLTSAQGALEVVPISLCCKLGCASPSLAADLHPHL